jgi:hypothetical protein
MPPRRSSLCATGGTTGATATGTNRSGTVAVLASRASLRQPCTMLALMSCAIATLASDAPGCSRSTTIYAYSCAYLWRLRLFCVSSCPAIRELDRYRRAASI